MAVPAHTRVLASNGTLLLSFFRLHDKRCFGVHELNTGRGRIQPNHLVGENLVQEPANLNGSRIGCGLPGFRTGAEP